MSEQWTITASTNPEDWPDYYRESTSTPIYYNYPCCACYHQLQQLLDKLDKLIKLLTEKEEK